MCDIEYHATGCDCDPELDAAIEAQEARRDRAQRRAYSGAYFVNVYLLDREYGGPEEGGWWWYSGKFLKSRPCRTRDEAHRIMDRWNRFLDHGPNSEGNHDLSSVNCEGRYRAQCEREPGHDFPEYRPHYE